VETLQKALRKIKAATLPQMPDITDPPGVYGQSTADAVRKYKEVNAIQRTGQPLDDIVGRMTISRLDEELKNLRSRPGPAPTPPPPPVVPEPNILPIAFCKQNSKILLDGTTAINRTPPMQPADWLARTQATFDTICSNRLGKQLVESIREVVVVVPFLKNEPNAQSDGKVHILFGEWILEFTADVFDAIQGQPGARADEVLLHEIIHMLEHNFAEYEDPADNSLNFDRTDFLTINGTNVYSAAQPRNLRKDHHDFATMPTRYASDAREHMILFRENYEKAINNNRALFDLFKNQPASWNPFASFTQGVTKSQFTVEVSGDKEFKWLYDLFSDSTARWIDKANVAEYGTGTWRQTDKNIIVDWKGGGFDRFPAGDPGETVTGVNVTGGIIRDSEVTRLFKE
jgi:hypothetical protein